MRNAACILIAFSGQALAHPGHGAADGHFHGWGPEHALLFGVIFLILTFVAGRK